MNNNFKGGKKMNPFVYNIPTKVYFGENQLGHLGEELKKFGILYKNAFAAIYFLYLLLFLLFVVMTLRMLSCSSC